MKMCVLGYGRVWSTRATDQRRAAAHFNTTGVVVHGKSRPRSCIYGYVRIDECLGFRPDLAARTVHRVFETDGVSVWNGCRKLFFRILRPKGTTPDRYLVRVSDSILVISTGAAAGYAVKETSCPSATVMISRRSFLFCRHWVGCAAVAVFSISYRMRIGPAWHSSNNDSESEKMRYIPGSISLSAKDGGLLEIVGTATRITHQQLFELARLKLIEIKKQVYDWRVRRLVTHSLLKQDKTLFLGSDPVYSITRNGISGLQQLGIHLVSVYIESKGDEIQHQIQHTLELNRIHIALLSSGVLSRWTPAKVLQALNMASPFDYAKYYDAVAALYMDDQRLEIAIEYEHTLKSPVTRYAAVKAKLEKEQRADVIIFVIPAAEIGRALRSQLRDLRKQIMMVDLQI